MVLRFRIRFSVFSLLVLNGCAAFLVCWSHVPDRTASRLMAAIEQKDREEIRRLCTTETAGRLIRELDRKLFNEVYTPEYLAIIRHASPKHEPNRACRIEPKTWDQVLLQTRQLTLRLNGATFVMKIKGSRAIGIDQHHEIISFTFPFVR